MSPKAKKVAKAEAPKKAAKAAPAPVAGKKGAKAAIVEEVIEVKAAEVSDEDAEEEEELAAASSSSGGGSAAALAAVATGTEVTTSLKNFRHHPDMENFYRFIYENDLRIEALQILDEIMAQRQVRKEVKGAKARAH